uniref:Uncharacterized protein n=1 Tax=Oryza sativa subsp. japonica TaxID=39947 RepID=Q6K3B7_ORYSJ|nr:hypothetical protein [Oryza sativa Japonica Group]
MGTTAGGEDGVGGGEEAWGRRIRRRQWEWAVDPASGAGDDDGGGGSGLPASGLGEHRWQRPPHLLVPAAPPSPNALSGGSSRREAATACGDWTRGGSDESGVAAAAVAVAAVMAAASRSSGDGSVSGGRGSGDGVGGRRGWIRRGWRWPRTDPTATGVKFLEVL